MADIIPPSLKDARGTRQLVYLALAHHSECRATTIIDDLGSSPGTVYPALYDLEDLGLAKRRPALHGTGYHWRLADDDPAITGEISGGEKVW